MLAAVDLASLSPFLRSFLQTIIALAILTALVRLTPTRLKDRLLVGYGVDLVIALFTIGPFVIAWSTPSVRAGGWLAWLIAPITADIVYTFFWCILDEAIRGEKNGFHIRTYWIRRDGWIKYLVGWFCFVAAPMFWIVRLSEIVYYPPLRWAWGFPHLRARDYIAFSRHKTKGLVGADYLYCLYCEWMTGVWSLGTEMLRHLESMWCPLRFGRQDQCERCAATFPDLDQWSGAEEGMAGVEKFFQVHYEGVPLGQRAHLKARSGASPTDEHS